MRQGGICVICGNPFEEYGHDANPVGKGRCCNACNSTKVIPARLRAQRKPRDDNYDTVREREMDLGDKLDRLTSD